MQLYETTIKAIERLFICPPLMWFLLMSVQHFDCAKYGLFLKLRTSAACACSRLYTFHWLCSLLESSTVMRWWGMLWDSCVSCHHVTSIYLFSWVYIVINCIHQIYLIGWKHAWDKWKCLVFISVIQWRDENTYSWFPLSLKNLIFTAWM